MGADEGTCTSRARAGGPHRGARCRESAGLHGEGAPASNAGAPPPATGARPAPGPRPHLARGSVSEAEALEASPRSAAQRRALVVLGAAPAQSGARRASRARRRRGAPAGRRAGEERWVDAEAAEAAGYTLVDLSRRLDALHLRRAGSARRAAAAQPLSARLPRPGQRPARRATASRCQPGEKNYLELYGIFPSLSVLRARFIDDEEHPCHDQESADALEAVETVTYVPPADLKKDERRLARIRAASWRRARRRPSVATLRRAGRRSSRPSRPR